jgi:hypothetical protein
VNVTIQITLEFDRAKESLPQFFEKRKRFMEHITRMQLNGSLPVQNDIQWTVVNKRTRARPTDELPPIEGRAFVDMGGGQLVAVHRAGDRML